MWCTRWAGSGTGHIKHRWMCVFYKVQRKHRCLHAAHTCIYTHTHLWRHIMICKNSSCELYSQYTEKHTRLKNVTQMLCPNKDHVLGSTVQCLESPLPLLRRCANLSHLFLQSCLCIIFIALYITVTLFRIRKLEKETAGIAVLNHYISHPHQFRKLERSITLNVSNTPSLVRITYQHIRWEGWMLPRYISFHLCCR